MKIAYLDHYDSFTFNLIDWLMEEGDFELQYVAHDDREQCQALASGAMPLVISPGPLNPQLLPATMALIHQLMGRVPLFGICLGHQCLGVALGAAISRARHPFHGSGQEVRILQESAFINSLSTSFVAAHYNSLVLTRGSLDEALVWAENCEHEIEGLYWRGQGHPALGVQYHPESFLSEDQGALRRAWRDMVKEFYRPQSTAGELPS